MTSRAQFLANIKHSLQTSYLPAAAPELVRGVPNTPAPETAALVELFTRELTTLTGVVYQPHDEEAAIELILKIIREAQASEVLHWDESELPVRGLLDALTRTNLKQKKFALAKDVPMRKAQVLELDAPLVGITGALAGLADTGSLVLLSGAQRSRVASLTPLTHIALLRTRDLYPDLAAFIAAHPNLAQDASNLVLITGPSRTADIEFNLVRGVHGPKFIHTLLLK